MPGGSGIDVYNQFGKFFYSVIFVFVFTSNDFFREYEKQFLLLDLSLNGQKCKIEEKERILSKMPYSQGSAAMVSEIGFKSAALFTIGEN